MLLTQIVESRLENHYYSQFKAERDNIVRQILCVHNDHAYVRRIIHASQLKILTFRSGI